MENNKTNNNTETPVYNISPNEELREIVAEIRKEAGDRTSEAKRIKEMIRKKKKWIGEEIKTVPFKEPVMFLGRRSGEYEFYEVTIFPFIALTLLSILSIIIKLSLRKLKKTQENNEETKWLQKKTMKTYQIHQ